MKSSRKNSCMMMPKLDRSVMNPIDSYSGPREECGIIAVYDPQSDAARTAFYGLFALQHRGQEAAGIASFDERMVHLKKLPGKLVIGHNRYSTTGLPSAKNAQPFLVTGKYGPIAIAHNGNIVNAPELRRELLEKGIGLTSTSDTELMLMSLGLASGKTWVQRIRNAMKKWIGAFSFVLLTEEGVYAVRDPWGFRPLSYGKTSDGA
ncbi:MAG: class II glutamine amidotransferase, partial [Spirochaetia bacterium]|nr:class II glutamine amidotransferase [Spirochaetia bacterium]